MQWAFTLLCNLNEMLKRDTRVENQLNKFHSNFNTKSLRNWLQFTTETIIFFSIEFWFIISQHSLWFFFHAVSTTSLSNRICRFFRLRYWYDLLFSSYTAYTKACSVKQYVLKMFGKILTAYINGVSSSVKKTHILKMETRVTNESD